MVSLARGEVFVPDGVAVEAALSRTTHMAISAHQDDVEIMAYHGVLECFGRADRWLTAVVVTDGAGSSRDGIYAEYTDAEMQAVRRVEQKKAATIGEYSTLALLSHPSSVVKDPQQSVVADELKSLLATARPRVIYTHNPADKHDTHVAVALRVIAALREMPSDVRPEAVYGCEVWRDLDWMLDDDKVALNVEGHESLAAALLGVFDSQIAGGKRYDLATLGRRRAHATYHASHDTDETTGLTFAMDLTPLVRDTSLDVAAYVGDYVQRLAADVAGRLKKLS